MIVETIVLKFASSFVSALFLLCFSFETFDYRYLLSFRSRRKLVGKWVGDQVGTGLLSRG